VASLFLSPVVFEKTLKKKTGPRSLSVPRRRRRDMSEKARPVLDEANPAFMEDDAKVAAALQAMYASGRFAEAHEHLLQLSSRRADDSDSRVLHNLALADYGARGNVEALREALRKVRARVDPSKEAAAPLPLDDSDATAATADTGVEVSLVDYNLAVAAIFAREYKVSFVCAHAQEKGVWVAFVCLSFVPLITHPPQGRTGHSRDGVPSHRACGGLARGQGVLVTRCVVCTRWVA
jgi:hypothetical protein